MDSTHRKIRSLRMQRGITLDAVASAIGMSKGNLSRLERGEVQVTAGKLKAIADFFEISVNELLQTESEEEDSNVRKLLQTEAKMERMHRAIENFIVELTSHYSEEFEEEDGLHEDEAFKKAIQKVFDTPGIERILNDDYVKPSFPFLIEFKKHRVSKEEREREEMERILKKKFGSLKK